MKGLTATMLITGKSGNSCPPTVTERMALKYKLVNFRTQEMYLTKNPSKISVKIGASNPTRNRYANILPFDETRVHIAEPERVGLASNYINASWVRGEGDQRYIVTQAPMSSTIAAFWAVVWEQRCTVIVNLTRRYEDDQEKCARYWQPNINTSSFTINDMTVALVESVFLNKKNIAIRTFKVSRGTETRYVTQLHYREWPDFGTPSSTAVMRKFVDLVNEYSGCERAPLLIHCSAGVGRAGVFVVLHILCERLTKMDYFEIDDFDVSKLIVTLRQYRQSLVQTVEQYEFIYCSLYDHIQQLMEVAHSPMLEEIASGLAKVLSEPSEKELAELEAELEELKASVEASVEAPVEASDEAPVEAPVEAKNTPKSAADFTAADFMAALGW